MTDLMNETCRRFSDLLAAKITMPGGGSAAALTGSLGSALCSMTANFTLGKKKYADVENDVKRILENSERLRLRLLELSDEDAKAFPELSEAWKLPTDYPEREKIYERAALNACKAPSEMVMCCCEAIDLILEIAEKGSIMLISDAGCGALLCSSAMQSAAMNVFINTSSLKDCQEAREIEEKIDNALSEYVPKAQKIAEKVMNIFRKGE